MAWYRDVAEIVVPVDCGGSRHHIRWRRGRLRLDDHDAEAEEALYAFGGARPRCLELLQLWRAAVRDGGFVHEWATRPRPDLHRTDWLEVALRRLRTEGVQDLLVSLPPARAERMGSVLVAFPLALQDRAALAVAARLLRGGPEPGGAGQGDALRGHLAEAVRQRARIAFVASLRDHAAYARPAALVPLTCEVDPAAGSAGAAELTSGARPSQREAGPSQREAGPSQREAGPSQREAGPGCEAAGPAAIVSGRLAGRDSWCHLRLSPRWLLDVWGPGAAVVDGHFIVALDRSGPPGADAPALAVRWLPGPGATARASLGPARLSRLPDGAWRLRWR